jgi:hypothetical protein
MAKTLVLKCLILISFILRISIAAPSITTKDVVDKTAVEVETSLSEADFKKLPEKEVDLRQLGIDVSDDPTLGNKAEGDIAVLNLRKFMDEQSAIGRNAIRQSYRRWPNNEIPYTLSSQYGSYSRSIIAKAMNEYHTKTCIKFIARDANIHKDYVYIHPDDGCYSLVGRTGGKQPLSLDSGCIQTGTIVHELMHTVGFFHEQSRYDRDDYIEISWPNVINGADDQFEKYSMNVIDQMNEPYDYSSIMHYGPYAFSSNGKKTIIARKPGAGKMGQRIQFSEIDLRKINKLYQCNISTLNNNGKNNNNIVSGNTASTINTSNTKNECIDQNWRCAFWSMSIFGYCQEYKEIREIVCPKSCGTCMDLALSPREVCGDKSPICKHIKRSSCNSPLTQITCQKACGLCDKNLCQDKADWSVCQSVVILQLCSEHDDCNRTCGFCK